MINMYSTTQLRELGEKRFTNAEPDRCYRNIILPLNVKHSSDIDVYRKGVTSNKETIIGKPESQDLRGLMPQQLTPEQQVNQSRRGGGILKMKQPSNPGLGYDLNFCSWLNSIGLEIEFLRLFTNAPNHVYARHVDKMDLNDQTTVLNFPFNDDGTKFSWYNLAENGILEKKLNSNNVPTYFFKPEHCEEILNLEIQHEYNQPILINAGYIHSVCVGNTDRYCFSYVLKRKNQKNILQWDDAMDIFAPYMIQS